MANFVVTNLDDSGAGSLRRALADAEAAGGADTVTFAGGLAGGTIRLTSGRLVIAADEVDIDGDLDNDGDADITISGDSNDNGIADAGDSTLMLVQGGSTVGIDGIVFANGASFGASGFTPQNATGAIENLGALTIANSVFRDNFARGGDSLYTHIEPDRGGDAAGAIRNAGTLTITDTAFENNRAEGGKGSLGENGNMDFPIQSELDGSDGGDGGAAAAGILNLASGTLALANATFRDGVAEGGEGGNGGNGSISFDFFPGGNGGDGGDGGAASFGIISNGSISGNLLTYLGGSLSGGLAGAGGAGAPGFGGPDPTYGYYGDPGAAGAPGVTGVALLNFGGGSPEVTIFGTALADTFAGTAGVDHGFGLDGADNIAGLAGNDTLAGGAGNDTLDGGTGADSLTGGSQNDTYVVDDAGDRVVEPLNKGFDTVRTSLNVYNLGANLERVDFIGTGNFAASGNDLDNRFVGGAGNDRFVSSLGNDTYGGGGGVDAVDFRTSATGAVLDFSTATFAGAATGDIFGSIEKFYGSSTAGDAMTGTGINNYRFAGYGGADTLTGAAGIDVLQGGDGDDQLAGNAGVDTLQGDGGNDTMTGGADGDAFLFVGAGLGTDTVTDFEDGLDYLKVHSSFADEFSDFAITGNGTTSVTLDLVGSPGNSIVLNGAVAITVSAADFLFY